MKAKIGDVYTIYNNRLRLYTACQITNVIEDKGDAICLYLDWTGESPLHLVQMENLQPLYMDFMYWEAIMYSQCRYRCSSLFYICR